MPFGIIKSNGDQQKKKKAKKKSNGDQHVHNLEATYVTKVTSS